MKHYNHNRVKKSWVSWDARDAMLPHMLNFDTPGGLYELLLQHESNGRFYFPAKEFNIYFEKEEDLTFLKLKYG